MPAGGTGISRVMRCVALSGSELHRGNKEEWVLLRAWVIKGGLYNGTWPVFSKVRYRQGATDISRVRCVLLVGNQETTGGKLYTRIPCTGYVKLDGSVSSCLPSQIMKL